MWMPPPRAWPIVVGTVAFGALALFTEMTAFAFVYIAVAILAILALMVWVGRSRTWDLRVVVGSSSCSSPRSSTTEGRGTPTPEAHLSVWMPRREWS
jgi:hypothetical protein